MPKGWSSTFSVGICQNKVMTFKVNLAKILSWSAKLTHNSIEVSTLQVLFVNPKKYAVRINLTKQQTGSSSASTLTYLPVYDTKQCQNKKELEKVNIHQDATIGFHNSQPWRQYKWFALQWERKKSTKLLAG